MHVWLCRYYTIAMKYSTYLSIIDDSSPEALKGGAAIHPCFHASIHTPLHASLTFTHAGCHKIIRAARLVNAQIGTTLVFLKVCVLIPLYPHPLHVCTAACSTTTTKHFRGFLRNSTIAQRSSTGSCEASLREDVYGFMYLCTIHVSVFHSCFHEYTHTHTHSVKR